MHKKTGFPEESEIVMCTVTKVYPTSVFANLNEYNKSGMLHISEVSPGRIRNIRDYVKEGKVIVCKVLNINKERGHIDLSLRRVTESQRKAKVNEIKQEQLAEKIVEFAAKKLKIDVKELYSQITDKAFKDFPSLYSCFEAVVSESFSLEKLGIQKKISQLLEEVIKQRIKPISVKIGGNLSLKSYAPNGVEIVKQGLEKVEKLSKDITLRYIGGGAYKIDITASDYKTAEKILKQAVDNCINYMEKNNGQAVFTRIEK